MSAIYWASKFNGLLGFPDFPKLWRKNYELLMFFTQLFRGKKRLKNAFRVYFSDLIKIIMTTRTNKKIFLKQKHFFIRNVSVAASLPTFLDGMILFIWYRTSVIQFVDVTPYIGCFLFSIHLLKWERVFWQE